ncbi:hypothetical protein JCGZ_10813 [Jatropha curcas]|uniref:Uncharacterized protein n=1 Tax=Jatropha curcas TaxID=180498 RepID=A0A067KT23_JATCU|nr:hypothetical protein JCGZ_10813 [Jatropha curcas]
MVISRDRVQPSLEQIMQLPSPTLVNFHNPVNPYPPTPVITFGHFKERFKHINCQEIVSATSSSELSKIMDVVIRDPPEGGIIA